MKHRILVPALVLALAATFIAAYAYLPLPGQFHVAVSPPKTPADAGTIDEMRKAVSGGPKAWSLSSDVPARRLFPKARFPRETFGRRLLWIGYSGVPTEQELRLIYEGGLVIEEIVSSKPIEIPNAGGSQVAIGQDTGRLLNYGGALQMVRVDWKAAGAYFFAYCPGMTEEQLLAVARSMKP